MRRPTSDLIEIACACANARRAARLVTQLYSHEMGEGIEPGQFALLSAIESQPGCTQASLGRGMGFDKTTLSRNMRLMMRNGWIETDADGGYRVSGAGIERLAETKPRWKRAQQKLRSAMRSGDWERMMNSFNLAATAALEARKA